MGKLERIGQSILRRIASPRRRNRASTAPDGGATSSSDDERTRGNTQQYVHTFTIDDDASPPSAPPPPPPPKAPPISDDEEEEEEGSAGYATDDTVLSLDVKTFGSESQGYYSNAELSPRDSSALATWRNTPSPLKEYPRVNVSLRKNGEMCRSSHHIATHQTPIAVVTPKERAMTVENLAEIVATSSADPIDSFLRSSVYKTKMITTVFEAKNGGFEEIHQDVIDEIDRWFETKNMLAVACEMHWSVPRESRSRQLESKLKDKLLNALRENNRRLLYLRGMGRGKTPVKLAESSTLENITRDKETDSVRGIYQRCYTRLLPYLHKETPEWHSQYWTLSDIQNNNDTSIYEKKIPSKGGLQPAPQQFLFGSEPPEVLQRNSLISLNIIGLSILGNSRKSTPSLFFS